MAEAAGYKLLVGIHGYSDKNAAQGRHGKIAMSQSERLTHHGISQAERMAAYIVEKTVLFVESAANRTVNVISSTYARCEETAVRIIHAIMGKIAVSLAREIKTSFQVYPDLRGLDLGLFAGMSYEEMAALDPNYIRGLMLWHSGVINQPPELPQRVNGQDVRGESNAAFAARMSASVEDIKRRHGGEPVALVLSSSAGIGVHHALARGPQSDSKTELAVPFIKTDPGTVEDWVIGANGIALCANPGFREPVITAPELIMPGRTHHAPDVQPGPSIQLH